MKNYKIKTLGVLAFAAAVFLAGCKGGAGDPGPTGTNGVVANNGFTGAGYTEAIKNGHIQLVLEGIAPGGASFKDTIDFPFSPRTVEDFSEVLDYSQGQFRFDLKRFSGPDFTYDDGAQSGHIEMRLINYIDEQTGTTFYEISGRIVTSVAVADTYYYDLNESFYNTDGSNFEDENFSNFNYDPSSGKFKFNFEFVLPGSSNSIGSDLKVTGVIDATVYEYINPG